MYRRISSLVIVALVLGLAVSPLFAQEAVERSVVLGKVVSIDAATVVLQEEVPGAEPADVSYSVDPAVVLTNAAAITDVLAGDVVELTYEMNGENKLVKAITKIVVPIEEVPFEAPAAVEAAVEAVVEPAVEALAVEVQAEIPAEAPVVEEQPTNAVTE